MIIDASYKNNGTQARLTSPTYTKLSDTGCLTFWYHMWGADMGTLNVAMKKGGEITYLFTKTGDQGNSWRSASAPLDLSGSSTFQIIFDGVVSHKNGQLAEVLGDIAIDDVSVNRLTSCGVELPTTVNNEIVTTVSDNSGIATAGSNSTSTAGILRPPGHLKGNKGIYCIYYLY